MQVILQAQIFGESKTFTLENVAQGIAEKLIRRHPHIFADGTASTTEEVRLTWEQIKAQEKAAKGADPNDQSLSPQLDRYARTLPPMTAAMKISTKAAKVGFEWESLDGVWSKVHEELDEFRHALEHEPIENQEAEWGDLIFSLIQIARWRNLDPVRALQGTNRRFIDRFNLLESYAQKPLGEHTLDELEALWQTAKAQLRNH